MLKWTVMNKRETIEKNDNRRRSSAGLCTIPCDDAMKSATKTKRRRSSTTRRSSTSRRPANHRNSLCIDLDKENKYTSTPIKEIDEFFQLDAFRDVSNLTPKDVVSRRTSSAKKCKNRLIYSPTEIPKKKKQCIDPSHSQDILFSPNGSKLDTNYFRPFEAVDSHIEGLTTKDFNELNCGCDTVYLEEKPILNKRMHAPTLPTFAMDYSPCPLRTTHNLIHINSPRRKKLLLKFTDICPPNKKAKIDHVNDFLQQISYITSPEDDRFRFPSLHIATDAKTRCNEAIKVSPLVKRLVDLRFSEISYDKLENHNNSSFINDLSLDKIVDAILDSSSDSNNSNNYDNKDISFDKRSQQRENELNETREENLINTEHERQSYTSVSFSDKNSTDSGFRSTTTEPSHEIDINFMCTCNNNTETKSRKAICGETHCDRTIINLEETFNERCVDVNTNSRKRINSSTNNDNSIGGKRLIIENPEFALKRQKCIRRRKLDDPRFNSVETEQTTIASECTEANDHSFDSYNSGLIESGNSENLYHETFIVETPEIVNPLPRNSRCLSFEMLNHADNIGNSSTPKQSVQGNMDLDIEYNNSQLFINILKCVDLKRSKGGPINAYVKVAISECEGNARRKQKGTLQRTAVQAESTNPIFNHIFKVPFQKNDHQKVLYIEVWHRDRITRRSEFLGCIPFLVKHAITKNISGTYRLLPQNSGRSHTNSIDINYLEEHRMETPGMYDCHSSIEEALGFDDIEKNSTKASLTQQQKDADENIFLRYLELDPTEGIDAAAAATQRKATGKCNGRTPFTTTNILRRPPKSGFGFSVVWTHPPRIERVEKGLPADKAGILPGDYLIFVDKHNVVMMPEIEILNLIRSFGNQLTLETFRKVASRNGSVPSIQKLTTFDTGSTSGLPLAPPSTTTTQRRPSTACSTNATSVEYNRKKLQLPQVTFSTERPTNSADEARRKAMYQILIKEQQYATALQFAVSRFVSALAERKDLISPAEHRILFQNSDEILRITEDILDILVQDDGDYQTHLLLRTYHLKLHEITSAYKRYCSGLKKADCVLANITKKSEFVQFLEQPAIPRRRPDVTVFIHKPLEHYREILKLFNVILSNTKSNYESYPLISQIVNELQVSYREMTSETGLMEPMGEGKPLLSVQDLENRLVFTKCKPFVLTKPGRQWIFGGNLSRVEGRSVRQYYALLFSDILLFAKVSRDRVLFILEDPLPLTHIAEINFTIRKKANEFRIMVEPGGMNASSPTVHCGPDLSRTPKKNTKQKCVVLRTPTVELKAVWQNLLQRQIFHVNAGMDGSSYSSPLESPEVPITSSVVTLQSAESYSLRRQSPRYISYAEKEQKKEIDELIEHKCKQLGKSSTSSKSNAIHLEQWMKGQLDETPSEQYEAETDLEEYEVWSDDMIRKRSQELQLIDLQGNPTCKTEAKRTESRCEEYTFSDQDQSPSRSTNTTESQVTVRSSPIVPETVSVCRQCHKTCISNQNCNGDTPYQNNHNNINCKNNNHSSHPNNTTNSYNEIDDDWRPLMLMGLNAINPAAMLIKLDPFAAPPPQISILPPTPETKIINNNRDTNCNCHHPKPTVGELNLNKEYDYSPDDSPLNDEQPYHSLNGSNLTLKRFGTVSSLERFGSEDREETFDAKEFSSDSEKDDEEFEDDHGIDNEAFHNTSLSWTARAGSYVAEKMSFFEKLGEDYRTGGKFFERYLKNGITNGEEVQEEETSGATSGEEIWGTPTSGGELDDPLSSPNYDGRNSPVGESLSSNEDTELMMDELLMTPPVTSANIRGLLPRRTLEPLMEEEYSDTYTSSSSSSPTEQSLHSPEQGNGTGDAADKCSTAAEIRIKKKSLEELDILEVEFQSNSILPMIHRSESYRRIIDAEDDNVGFFTRFRNRPSMKFVNFETIPPARGVKFLEFFNMRRERKIYETFPQGKHLIKVFSKEGEYSDDVPTSYSEKPEDIRRFKERQLDRRFWKQLSKRRGNKPVQLSA